MNLREYINRSENEPFVWGETDCLNFVSGALEAQGFDPLPTEWTSGYTTARGGALRYRRMRGTSVFSDIVDAMDHRFDRVVTLHPDHGMIVARRCEEGSSAIIGFSFGIVYGPWLMFKGVEHGLLRDTVRAGDMFWGPK